MPANLQFPKTSFRDLQNLLFLSIRETQLQYKVRLHSGICSFLLRFRQCSHFYHYKHILIDKIFTNKFGHRPEFLKCQISLSDKLPTGGQFRLCLPFFFWEINFVCIDFYMGFIYVHFNFKIFL
jgi:hypothetical protein